MKTIFLSAALTFAATQADAQTAFRNQGGEFLTVSAAASGYCQPFSDGSDFQAILDESEGNLNKKATEACSGHEFSVDASSVRRTTSRHGRIFTVTTTARVFCL